MTQPYKMSFINAVLFAVYVLYFLWWKKKGKKNYFIPLLLLSLIPLWTIFRPGAYESGDFDIHIYRTIEFFNSLRQGILMPSWAPNLNATYGYPLFIFNYVLPYYLISVIKFFIPTFILSEKIFLASTFVLSGFGMYFFAKKEFKNEFPAFICAIFYLFVPYHLIDMNFKVVVGELLSFAIIPFVCLFWRNYFEKKKIIYLILTGLFLGLLVMSHIVIALFTSVLLSFYTFCLISEKLSKKTILLAFIAAIATLVSLYESIGPILLYKYTYEQIATIQDAYFPKLTELLFAPWRFGFLFQGPYGQLSYLIGYAQLLLLIIVLISIFIKKSKTEKRNSLLVLL